MRIEKIIEEVKKSFDGIVVDKNWGETVLFYNPDNLLPKGVYLMTFKEKDGPNDMASNINREGVYRLNIGITKGTFIKLFGEQPRRPKAGKTIDMPFQFNELNKIMPHPIYGWMYWIGILNPSKNTFQEISPLIEEGYNLATSKYKMRLKKMKLQNLNLKN